MGESNKKDEVYKNEGQEAFRIAAEISRKFEECYETTLSQLNKEKTLTKDALFDKKQNSNI